MVSVHWRGDMKFEAIPPAGQPFIMDAYPEEPGQSAGPTPLEAFLSAVAACGAMDVIAILKKKRQEVESYRIEIDGDRTPPGSPYPRPYTALRIRHIVKGNVDPDALKRAVELSDEKYCSVIATLRVNPQITSEWSIENS